MYEVLNPDEEGVAPSRGEGGRRAASGSPGTASVDVRRSATLGLLGLVVPFASIATAFVGVSVACRQSDQCTEVAADGRRHLADREEPERIGCARSTTSGQQTTLCAFLTCVRSVEDSTFRERMHSFYTRTQPSSMLGDSRVAESMVTSIRGDCPRGMRRYERTAISRLYEAHGGALPPCLLQSPSGWAMIFDAMDLSSDVPSRRSCGLWMDTFGANRVAVGVEFSFLDLDFRERSMWDFARARASASDVHTPTETSRLLGSCRRAVLGGEQTFGAALWFAYTYLTEPIRAVRTGEDLARAIGSLAASGCPTVVSVDVLTDRTNIGVRVSDRPFERERKDVLGAMMFLGIGDEDRQAAEAGFDLLLEEDASSPCATSSLSTQIADALISGLGDREGGKASGDRGGAESGLRRLRALACSVERPDDDALPAVHGLLRGSAALCVRIAAERIRYSSPTPRLSHGWATVNDASLRGSPEAARPHDGHQHHRLDVRPLGTGEPHEREGGRTTAMMGRVSRSVGLDQPTVAPLTMGPPTREEIDRAATTAVTMELPGRTDDEVAEIASPIDADAGCYGLFRYALPDHADLHLFSQLVPDTLYERLRLLTERVRASVADVCTDVPEIASLLSDPESTADRIRGTVVRLAGAPVGTWAGRAAIPEIESPIDTTDFLTTILRQMHTKTSATVRRAMDNDEENPCDGPPLYDTSDHNAYWHRHLGCVWIMAGMLTPPVADDSYDDVSLLGRIGFVLAHELAHVVPWDDAVRVSDSGLLRAYPRRTTHPEALADVVAMLAIVRIQEDACEMMLLHMGQLFCQIPDAPRSDTHPSGTERVDALATTLWQQFGVRCVPTEVTSEA